MLSSIVVPAHNVEKYLRKCLDSILACPEDFEVICVNDGSTDGSGTILRKYAIKDKRVRLLEQENRGLSAARNAGVAAARGEYILYIDSDDFVRTEYLTSLIEAIKSYFGRDLFVTDFQMIINQRGKQVRKPIFQIGEERDSVEGLDFLPQMLSKRQCFWNVWRYAYRREFLLVNNVKFKEGFLCEDIDYITNVLLAEPDMVFLHCPFYCYRTGRSGSLMDVPSFKRISDVVTILQESCVKLADSDFPWRQEIIKQYQFEFILTLAQLYEVNKVDKPAVCKLFKDNLYVLQLGNDKIAHLFYRLCSALSVRFVARLLFYLKYLRRFWRGRHRYPSESDAV